MIRKEKPKDHTQSEGIGGFHGMNMNPGSMDMQKEIPGDHPRPLPVLPRSCFARFRVSIAIRS